jgi:peptide/nickel transport system substrate-binding protein
MLTIVADMKDIGVDLRLRQLDFPSMVSREFEGNFDLAAEGFGGSTDPDLTSVLATQSFAPAGGNTTRFSNPEADRLMAAGVRELDDAKRRVIYDKLQALVAEQVPYFYQYGRFAGVASAQRVDFGPRGLLQSPLCYFDVEDWSLRP